MPAARALFAITSRFFSALLAGPGSQSGTGLSGGRFSLLARHLLSSPAPTPPFVTCRLDRRTQREAERAPSTRNCFHRQRHSPHLRANVARRGAVVGALGRTTGDRQLNTVMRRMTREDVSESRFFRSSGSGAWFFTLGTSSWRGRGAVAEGVSGGGWRRRSGGRILLRWGWSDGMAEGRPGGRDGPCPTPDCRRVRLPSRPATSPRGGRCPYARPARPSAGSPPPGSDGRIWRWPPSAPFRDRHQDAAQD